MEPRSGHINNAGSLAEQMEEQRAGVRAELHRNRRLKSRAHSSECNLFVMAKNGSEDVAHLTISAGIAKYLMLHLPEGNRQFENRAPLREAPGCDE